MDLVSTILDYMASVRGQIEKLEKSYAEHFKQLRTCIKDGIGSTGDDLWDFAIVHFGEINVGGGGREEKLREIDSLLRAHPGQPLTVVRFRKNEGLSVRAGHTGGCWDPRNRSPFGSGVSPTHIWFGLISEGGVVVGVKEGTISLPVGEFALWTEKDESIVRNSSGPDADTLGILFDTADLRPLLLSADLFFTDNGETSVKMHIGTNDVLKFFLNERDGDVLFYRMARMLGYPEGKMPQDILEHVAAIKEGIRASLAEHREAIRLILASASRIPILQGDEDTVLAVSEETFKIIDKHSKEIHRLLVEAQKLGMDEKPFITDEFVFHEDPYPVKEHTT